jgi:hypothetical protein
MCGGKTLRKQNLTSLRSLMIHRVESVVVMALITVRVAVPTELDRVSLK